MAAGAHFGCAALPLGCGARCSRDHLIADAVGATARLAPRRHGMRGRRAHLALLALVAASAVACAGPLGSSPQAPTIFREALDGRDYEIRDGTGTLRAARPVRLDPAAGFAPGVVSPDGSGRRLLAVWDETYPCADNVQVYLDVIPESPFPGDDRWRYVLFLAEGSPDEPPACKSASTLQAIEMEFASPVDPQNVEFEAYGPGGVVLYSIALHIDP
jgi:hypothetical protein